MFQYQTVWCLVLVLGLHVAAAAETQRARLEVNIVDSSANPLPCRAWVDARQRRLFEPTGPVTCTPYRRDRSFSCEGQFQMDVPVGLVSIHVERGKEYLSIDKTVTVPANQTSTITLTLRRWVNMPSEGWYSSDMHVHFGADNRRVLRQLALADDVHVTPAFTYWLRGTEPTWPADWPTWPGGELDVIDQHHLITRKNIEIERIRASAVAGGSVGASFLFNLHQPVTAVRYGEHFPTDTTLCLAARSHSPQVVIDTDKPSWAETVVGAALGVYDTIQVCHNHYHRNQTIPGGFGMIGPLEDGESNAAEDDGLFNRTNDLYYRFLNCGFRIGVSGGSAIGVMPVPMGYNRVYAQIEGPLTPDRYWAAVRAGRSFATSGPMLTMTVDRQALGATIHRSASDRSALAVSVRVRTIDPLEAVQLVQDGKVLHQTDMIDADPGRPIDRTISWQTSPRRSGWLAARALFRAPDERLRQAHTSPIYVIIDNNPIARKADAEYMIRWIDRLLEIADLPDRFPTAADREQVERVYRQSRAVYQKRATDAQRIWGD